MTFFIIWIHVFVYIDVDSNIVESVALFGRVAVPVYFMISGYFYVNSKNRMKHIKSNMLNYGAVTISNYFIALLFIFISGETFFHHGLLVQFWFVYVLILMQIVTYRINRTPTIMLLVLLSILFTEYNGLNTYQNILGTPMNIFSFFGYFGIGMILQKIKIKSSMNMAIIYLSLFIVLNVLNVFIFRQSYGLYLYIPSILLMIGTLSLPKLKFNLELGVYSTNLFFWHYTIIDMLRYLIPIDTLNLLNAIILVWMIIIFISFVSYKFGLIDYRKIKNFIDYD